VIHRRELAAAQDPEAERARLARQYANAQLRPQVAAATGYVDELISPSDTRARLTWALQSLCAGAESPVPGSAGTP
jgi:propionyl-CoA carboxylase beta chain